MASNAWIAALGNAGLGMLGSAGRGENTATALYHGGQGALAGLQAVQAAGQADRDHAIRMAQLQGDMQSAALQRQKYLADMEAKQRQDKAIADYGAGIADPQKALAYQINPTAFIEAQQKADAPMTAYEQAQIDIDRGKASDPSSKFKIVGNEVIDLSSGKPTVAYRARNRDEPIEQVFDPETGRVTYVPRSQAVGQMVPPKSGMEITTNPDGTMSFRQGAGLGGSSLGNKARNDVETKIIDLDEKAARLGEIQQSFKPEYLQIMPQVGAAWSGLKDKFDMLGPEEQAALGDFAGFRQSAFNDLNQTLKEMSGAAVTPQEATRQLKVLPNPGEGIGDGDSPAEFKRKMDNMVRWTQLARARMAYVRANGLDVQTDNGGNVTDFGGVRIEDVPDLIDQRGEEVVKQLVDGGMSPEEAEMLAMDQVRKEFGL